MLVYIEFISRRPGISIEHFHAIAGAGQTGWAKQYGDDELLEEVAADGGGHHRGADAAGPDHEDSHARKRIRQARRRVRCRAMTDALRVERSGPGGAVARVTSSKLKELVITDSIQPTTAVQSAHNIRVISTANLIGEAINRTSAEESVSSLFD